jgi:hypothetical protein
MELKELIEELEEWKNTLLHSPEEVEEQDEGEIEELVDLCKEVSDHSIYLISPYPNP